MDINNIELFIYKFIISILMIITSFNYVSLKYTIKNIIYLYLLSIFLGGILYLINNSFDYHNGLVFYHNGLSINVILIVLITPVLLFFYIKNLKEYKNNYNNYYKLEIYINNKVIKSVSYLDTGNKLKSLTGKPVILLNNKDPVFNNLNYTLLPYNTIKDKGFIKCYKPEKVYIEGIGNKYNVLIGIIT